MEKPKTPEEIQKLTRSRGESDEDFLFGGAKYEGGRLHITEEQFETAKKEMEDDLDSKNKLKEQKTPQEVEKEIQGQITSLEDKLGVPISEESKEKILENQRENVQSGEKKEEFKEDPNRENRLKQEAEELGQKQKERENSANSLKEKMKNRDFTDSVRKLAIVFREREANRFNPIINPNAISYLASAANELDMAVANPRSSLEDINRSIKKIGGVIRAIGDVPRQMRVNDQPESLRRVGMALNGIGESSMELRSRAGALEDKNMAETFHLLRSLETLARDKWVYVARKRNDLEEIRR